MAESPLEFPASEIDLSPKLVNVDAVGKRDHILYSLQKQSAPVICVTTLKALLERTPSPESMIRDHLELRVGEELDPDTLLDLCKSLGYRHEALAREKGDFAFRGGIVDIFPIFSRTFRIEFWGSRFLYSLLQPFGSTLYRKAVSNYHFSCDGNHSYRQIISFTFGLF